MKTYKVYPYSRTQAIISFLLYFFIGSIVVLACFGVLPGFRMRYFALACCLMTFIVYCLSLLTAKGKAIVELKKDGLAIKWIRQILFRSALDKDILFSNIKSYRNVSRKFGGNILRLELNDGTRLDLCEKLLPWVRADDFQELAAHFALSHDTAVLNGFPVAVPNISTVRVAALNENKFTTAMNINAAVATKRKIGMFILISIASLFYWGYLGLMLTAMFIDEHNYGILCFSLLGYFMGFFNYYRYFQNCPAVRMDKEKITFNRKETYYWDEVEVVKFSGKQPFKYVGSTPMEGAMIRFKNGKTRYLFDSMYSNLWQVKSFIREVMQTKKEYAQWSTIGSSINVTEPVAQAAIPIQQVPAAKPYENIAQQYFVYFKGAQFSSFQAYLLWPVICIDVWGMIYINDWVASFFLSIGGFLWFLLLSWSMNYFGISDKYIVIRNQNLFWRKKLYGLDDIQEIRLDSPGKGGYTLNVVLKNFKEKAYAGATLSKRDWYALKTDLESKGVNVKDENYFTEFQSKGMKKANRVMVWYLIVYVVASISIGVVVQMLNVSPVTQVVLKVLWLLLMVVGVFGLRYLIVKLSKMADKIDNKDKDKDKEE